MWIRAHLFLLGNSEWPFLARYAPFRVEVYRPRKEARGVVAPQFPDGDEKGKRAAVGLPPPVSTGWASPPSVR